MVATVPVEFLTVVEIAEEVVEIEVELEEAALVNVKVVNAGEVEVARPVVKLLVVEGEREVLRVEAVVMVAAAVSVYCADGDN